MRSLRRMGRGSREAIAARWPEALNIGPTVAVADTGGETALRGGAGDALVEEIRASPRAWQRACFHKATLWVTPARCSALTCAFQERLAQPVAVTMSWYQKDGSVGNPWDRSHLRDELKNEPTTSVVAPVARSLHRLHRGRLCGFRGWCGGWRIDNASHLIPSRRLFPLSWRTLPCGRRRAQPRCANLIGIGPLVAIGMGSCRRSSGNPTSARKSSSMLS
jgi:hypothetical protein